MCVFLEGTNSLFYSIVYQKKIKLCNCNADCFKHGIPFQTDCSLCTFLVTIKLLHGIPKTLLCTLAALSSGIVDLCRLSALLFSPDVLLQRYSTLFIVTGECLRQGVSLCLGLKYWRKCKNSSPSLAWSMYK